MTALAARLRDPVLLYAVAGLVAATGWAAWLAGLAQAGCWGAGPHAGCPRVDFSAFWGAGRLAGSGRAGDAYAWPSLRAELQHAFGVGGIAPLPFLYPPPLLLAAAGLGALAYPAAFAAWTTCGLAAYAAASWAVLRRPEALAVACAPAGVFFCAFAGQTGLLTAAALAGALLCLERRPVLAGVLFALFACKPQLAPLVPIALVADRRWRVLGSAAVTYALLCAAAATAFGPQVFAAFARGATGGGGAFAGGGWLPWWKVQSVYGALRSAGAPALVSAAAQGLAALAAAAAVWTLWRGRARPELRAAALAAGALTVSPYGFVYDGPLLGIAAVFLLRDLRSGEAASAGEAVLLAAGLFGQAAFLVAPTSLVTPVTAWALLAAAGWRAARVQPTSEPRYAEAAGAAALPAAPS